MVFIFNNNKYITICINLSRGNHYSYTVEYVFIICMVQDL